MSGWKETNGQKGLALQADTQGSNHQRASVAVARPGDHRLRFFIRVKYHKDQANDKDYSNEGLGATFKKWQADNVSKHWMSEHPGVKAFEADKDVIKGERKTYGTGKTEGDAPLKDL